jgi:spore maturation protein CgeB
MSDNLKKLEDLIRASGEDWIIDYFHPKENAIKDLMDVLNSASAEAQKRGICTDFSAENLMEMFNDHPEKVRAFIQTAGSTSNPAMLVMVWRINQGWTISKVEVNYEEKIEFAMKVTLSSRYEDKYEEYCSDNIFDAVVLRHFGIACIGEKPVFDGYYALRIERR